MRTFKLILGLFLFIALGGTALAQNASVSGKVTDLQGAAIVGATVNLTNLDTQVTETTKSVSDGAFILPPAAPGRYEVKILADGFRPWQSTGVTIEVGEVKAINATLSVGAVSQLVTVQDTPPELQTENADRSTLLEPTFVSNLSLNVRNPLQLIASTVGVTYNDGLTSGTNNTTESTTNQFRINGSKYATTDLLIDGGADMVAYNSQIAGIPGVDATSEIRVLTTAYAPEYGYTSGGIVNYSIKSGTDKLHGGAWYYFRNQALDANGHNANAVGAKKSDLSLQQFGFQGGGPFIIPKLYNGRGKTFWFFSYEGLRQNAPAIIGGYSTFVPTDAMAGRNGLPGGDFSNASNSANYPSIPQIYDPANIVGGNRAVFAGNIIPAGRLNPVGQKLMQLFPSPTPGQFAASGKASNFFSNANEYDHDNSIDFRMDHQFNRKNSIFGHLDRFSNYINNPDYYGNNQEPTNSDDRIPGYHALVSHSWVIKDDLIFTHHGSWAHSESNRASRQPLSPSSVFGFNAAAAPGITDTFTPQVAAVAGQLGAIGNTEPLETNKSSVFQYQADISWLKGNHTIKLGGDIRRYFVQHYDPQGITLTGGRALTGGPTPSSSLTTGNAIAEILLGLTPITSGYSPRVTLRDMVYFVYAEDTWKLTPKLTVNYGLRYGIIGSWVTDGNILNYLDLTSPSPVAAAAKLPNLVGGMGIPGVSISARNLQSPSYSHVEPRIGLSYALNSNTVIHAGFGIFRHPQASEASYSELGGTSRTSTSVSSQTLSGSTVSIVPGSSPSSSGLYSLGDPFFAGGGVPPLPYGNNPSPLPGNNVGSGPLSINLGQSISGDLRKQSGPYQQIASLDVQRAFGHYVLTAAYINNEGVGLRSGIKLNQLSDATLQTCFSGTAAGDKTGATCTPLTNAVANPFYKVITDTSSALASATVPAAFLQRAYPQFTGFTPIDVGWAHSTYRALQITAQHREANGLAILLGYTFSKAIDQTGDGSTTASIQDNGCLPCERSISEQDSTHNLTANVYYELPFGHNHSLASSGPAAAFAGGWQIGGAFKFYTGLPVQLTQTATANVGNGALRPLIAQDVSLTPTAANLAFNPKAFTATPAYQFGNAPRYSANIRYPDYQNLDLFVQKSTRFAGERMGFTIRFEALNAPNSIVYGAPAANISNSNFGTKSTNQVNSPRQAQLSGRFTF